MDLIMAGEVDETTSVWVEGEEDWAPLSQVAAALGLPFDDDDEQLWRRQGSKVCTVAAEDVED